MRKYNLMQLTAKEIQLLCITYGRCNKCPLCKDDGLCPFRGNVPANWELI